MGAVAILVGVNAVVGGPNHQGILLLPALFGSGAESVKRGNMIFQSLKGFLGFRECPVHHIVIFLVIYHNHFILAFPDQLFRFFSDFTVIGQDVVINSFPLLEQNGHAGICHSHKGGRFACDSCWSRCFSYF